MIDDSGDRKVGKATAHIGHQWLGRLGKTDQGIVTMTAYWADENRALGQGPESRERESQELEQHAQG